MPEEPTYPDVMGSVGSIIFLHGVGGVRADWARPLADVEAGVALTAPTYADLLRPDALVRHRRPRWSAPVHRDLADAPDRADPPDDRDVARLTYLERQRLLAEHVRASGDALPEGMSWPSGLPRPGDLSARLPLARIVRSSLFGLDQVGRYLDDDERRDAVAHRVLPSVLIAPAPRVIIAHSLGSIVALDLLADPRVEVDLLITVGSPLGHEAVHGDLAVADTFPYDRVGGWLNVVHLLDPVPLGRGLHPRFPAAHDAFVPMVGGETSAAETLPKLVSTAGRALTAHLDSTYLATGTVRSAIAHVWQSGVTA